MSPISNDFRAITAQLVSAGPVAVADQLGQWLMSGVGSESAGL